MISQLDVILRIKGVTEFSNRSPEKLVFGRYGSVELRVRYVQTAFNQ